MNVMQILPELNVGGVETGTVDFAGYLVEKGHKSIVVSNGGKLVEQIERGGSVHYTLPVHKKSLFSVIRLIKVVRQIIVDEKVDIVHARSRIPGWIAYFACRQTNASFITTCHGHYGSRFYSQVMGKSKLVIVPSNVIGRHMIDNYGVSADAIRCVPRSVDLKRFNVVKKKNNDGQFVVSMVGRITPLKGHKYFIESMAKVIRSYPNVIVKIIGEAPAKKQFYKEELISLTRRLGIESNINFLGNRSDIPNVLAGSDLLVMSSIEPESFGRVVVEAQAVGVPVIATRIGGVIDVIDDEKTGLLVPPKDTEAMAAAVMRIIRNPQLAQQFVSAAKIKIAEQYTLEHMASRTLAVYEELLGLMNILVIKIGSIGDVILVTASLKALRKKFPKATIHCLVGSPSRKILLNCPYVDNLIIYDTNDKRWFKLLSLAKKIRKLKIDKVIDFQNNKRSHLLAWLSFAKESYGYDNGKWSFLLSHKIKNMDKNIAAVPHQFRVLNMLDMRFKDSYRLELWPSALDRKKVKELLEAEWLANAKIIVGINIAASYKWKTKNWPIDHIAKLCDMLAAENIRVVITGMQKDKALANKLISLTHSKPAIFVGKTDVLELAVLIKKCKVFITPDSSPMHIAAAMHTPFIVFFGPTDARRHLPPARKYYVFKKDLTCAPCYSTQCKILTHVCMQDIKPQDVFEKTLEFIEK